METELEDRLTEAELKNQTLKKKLKVYEDLINFLISLDSDFDNLPYRPFLTQSY